MKGIVSDNPLVSVILPVYRNRASLRELHRRLSETLSAQNYELIFVNDACPENSLEVLHALAGRDERVAVLALADNTGQHRALLTGMRYARGTHVVLLDADLQDSPEAVPALLAKLAEGYGAVFAGRVGPYQSRGRMWSSRFFKALLALLVGLPMNAGLFVALSRATVERLLAADEARPYVTGMIAWLGRPVATVEVARARRAQGTSAYTSGMRWRTGWNAVVRMAWLRCGGRAVSDLPAVKVACYGARFHATQ